MNNIGTEREHIEQKHNGTQMTRIKQMLTDLEQRLEQLNNITTRRDKESIGSKKMECPPDRTGRQMTQIQQMITDLEQKTT